MHPCYAHLQSIAKSKLMIVQDKVATFAQRIRTSNKSVQNLYTFVSNILTIEKTGAFVLGDAQRDVLTLWS